ncbi:gamma-glutamyl-gamma-aminobutyrate hydrolase family protein [Rhodococcus sp. NPDC055024]
MTATDTGPRIAIPVRIIGPATDPIVAASELFVDAIAGLVREAGALPVLVEPGTEESIEQVLATCHGILIPGGGDISPALYGEKTDHPMLFGIDDTQDQFDLAVMRFAFENERPLLAICRGMQLLNVFCGGTLHVHLESSPVNHSVPLVTGLEMSTHEIALLPGTRCATAYGNVRAINATSGHHQAVDSLGVGLRASAVAPDGIVEAIERNEESLWVLGIQWHPERDFPDAELRLPVFTAFVEQAQRVSLNSPYPADPERTAS